SRRCADSRWREIPTGSDPRTRRAVVERRLRRCSLTRPMGAPRLPESPAARVVSVATCPASRRRRRIVPVYRILVVCTGNVCRSPMAEGILRDLLENEGLGDQVEVRSAGTWAVSGSPASENAVRVSADLGVDIEEHRSTPLSHALIHGANLILTMEPGHLEEIVVHVPEA